MARAVLWEPVELPVDQRPETASDALFVVLKGARAGAPLSINGLEQIVALSAKTRAGSSTDASPIVVCVAVQTRGNDVGAARSPAAQVTGRSVAMSDAEMDELGPVDYLVVEFPAGRANFSGEMAAELSSLVAAGTIRILDLMIITKDDDGTIDAFEVDDFEGLDELRALETELADLLAGRRRGGPRGRHGAWQRGGRARLGEPVGGAVRFGGPPRRRSADRQRPDPDPGDPGVDGGRRGLDERRRLTCPSDLDELDGAA